MKPILIELPGGAYVAGPVPWRIYKAIARLAGFSSADVTIEDWYNLAGLVAAIFGDRFNVNDIKDKPPAELIAVLNQVMSRVSELLPKSDEKTQETPADPSHDWIVSLELSLANRFSWSLNDIDCTDVFSLIPFITQLNDTGNPTVFADQIDWL